MKLSMSKTISQTESRPIFGAGILFLLYAVLFAAARCRADEQPSETAEPDYTTREIRGQVVWAAEAMERLFGVQTVSEASQRVLALETSDGELHPLVEDVRGRAFRRDKRLRGIDAELLVRQYEGSPFVQVIQVFTIKEDGKYKVDYWCDICAIAMYELKACDCCQGPIELRERKVE